MSDQEQFQKAQSKSKGEPPKPPKLQIINEGFSVHDRRVAAKDIK